MTAGNNNFGPDLRSAVRRHWVLLLIPGVIMVVLGLLAAASPLVSTLVVDTAAGWMFLTAGFIGLAALFTTRNVPGLMWTLVGAVLAILVGAYLVWRPLEGLVSLTMVLAVYFVVHGVVQIGTAFRHRTLFPQSWLWMLLSGIADVTLAVIIIAGWPGTVAWALGLLVGINLFLSGLALVMTAIACRSVDPVPVESITNPNSRSEPFKYRCLGCFLVVFMLLCCSAGRSYGADALECPEVGLGSVPDLFGDASGGGLFTTENRIDLSNEINELINRLQIANPNTSPVEVRNLLIAAYCRTVARKPGLAVAEKWARMREFDSVLERHIAADIVSPGTLIIANVPLPPDVYRELKRQAVTSDQTPARLMAAILMRAAGK